MNTEKPWYIVDATDKILGRMASTIAIYIRGKNLATYTPSVDMGAFVIVVSRILMQKHSLQYHCSRCRLNLDLPLMYMVVVEE